jgi:aminomethyltransferase
MSVPMLKRTPLHDAHVAAGGRMVDFGGWQMPLHYGSQIEEHHAVRRDAGVFDVSHMRVVDASGAGSRALLRRLLSADIDRREPGQAMYTCLLDPQGHVLDDLIAYRCPAPPVQYRLVLNASTADRDLAWMRRQAVDGGFDADLASRDELAILALQGPGAAAALGRADPWLGGLASPLAGFHALRQGDLFIARTGYTGEDGFEIVLPAERVADLWRRLLAAGVPPCGLGARDTLRLEAGLCLYGQDLDDTVSPLESGLGWTVDLQDARDFIGRAALQRQAQDGPARRLLGLLLLERGVLRAHQPVQTDHGEGQVTSGTFSPTLQAGIGLARLPAAVQAGDTVRVPMRGRPVPARVVRPRFVRHGAPLV